MSLYLRNKALTAIVSAGLILPAAAVILPAAAAETAQTQGSDDQFWSEVAQYKSKGDGNLNFNGVIVLAQLTEDERTEDELTEEEKAETSAEGPQITVDQAEPTVRVNQPSPTVTVDQAQPTVTVDQAQPTVTVDQAQPTVTVDQAEPTVTVDQAQPTVTVDQAEPTVSVEQGQPQVSVEQGQPQVSVEQGQPQVSVEQGQPQVSVEQERSADTETSSADTEKTEASFDLTRYSADQLMSMKVENRQGNNLGNIEDVVIDANDEVFFVISSGGFLGMGGHSVALPAKDFQVVEDKLILQTSQSKEELNRLSQYNETQYEKHNW